MMAASVSGLQAQNFLTYLCAAKSISDWGIMKLMKKFCHHKVPILCSPSPFTFCLKTCRDEQGKPILFLYKKNYKMFHKMFFFFKIKSVFLFFRGRKKKRRHLLFPCLLFGIAVFPLKCWLSLLATRFSKGGKLSWLKKPELVINANAQLTLFSRSKNLKSKWLGRS